MFPRRVSGIDEQLAPEPEPCGDDASTAVLQEAVLQEEIKRLRKRLQRAEMEREIIKKATAYFARESQ